MTAVLSPNSLTVVERRYLRRNFDKSLAETSDGMFRRVANHVATAEKSYDQEYWAERFYERMANLEFLPNSPCLRNAGTNMKGTMSACFVIPIGDYLLGPGGIMDACTQSAAVQRYGGGTGFSFSRLRPKGSMIQGTHGAACGPIMVLKLLDAVSETITQGAAFRKGANMGVLLVSHPDIREFIHVKDDGVTALNFNISVAITADFMEALAGRSTHAYRYTMECLAETGKFNTTLNPETVFPLMFNDTVYDWVDAVALWDEIAVSAHTTGDPGLLFIDRANEGNPCPDLFTLESTNPCGEQWLEPYGSCNLGSINLTKFVNTGGSDTWDYYELELCVRECVRFLDDVVEVNDLPSEPFAEANKLVRRIGLGVMGFADALMTRKIPYASLEGITAARDVMGFIRTIAYDESKQLAGERGNYPAWQHSTHAAENLPLRNMMLLTVAPTGSISLIAGCSSGIEPLFDLEWDRQMVGSDGGVVLREQHPAYQTYLEEGGDPTHRPQYLETSKEIPLEWHIAMQAAFQMEVDNSISKTINMPNNANVDDIKRAYMLAYTKGCKGITIYRDGSRFIQILNSVTVEPQDDVVYCPDCKEEGKETVMINEEHCFKCYVCGLAFCG